MLFFFFFKTRNCLFFRASKGGDDGTNKGRRSVSTQPLPLSLSLALPFLSFSSLETQLDPPPQVSLIQPVSGIGLVILALYSHFFLGERLNKREWRAAAAALVGTALLGATSPPDASPPPPPAARAISVILACSALALGLPSVLSALAERIGGRGRGTKGGGGKGGPSTAFSHSSSPPLRSGFGNVSDKSSSSSSTSAFHHRANSSSLQQTNSYSLQSRPKTPTLVAAAAANGGGAVTDSTSSPPSASFVSLPAGGAPGTADALNRPWPPGLGLRAGLVFGLSTTACRAGFALAPAAAKAAAAAALLLASTTGDGGRDDEAVAAAASAAAASAASLSRLLGLAASAALSAAGLALQTAGLKDGNSVSVCTCASVASMLAGVASGAWALAEPVLRPGGGFEAAASRVFAMGLTIWGVAALAGAGSGGGESATESSSERDSSSSWSSSNLFRSFFRPLAAAATGKVLPKKARRVLLPPGARQALRKFEADAARVPLLPTSAAATPEKSCKN